MSLPSLPTFSFRPRLLDSLAGYDARRFARDLGAGLTVAIVALPLAMAFAIASGAKPEAGIFTAVIAGFIISALGGSSVQIGGPAGAFIVVIYGIIEKYGLANLFISTILAGGLLFAMGFFRLGSLIRYIPVPIVIGFTNGIAVLIAVSQFKDFFGLAISKMPGDFFSQASVMLQAAPSADPVTLAVGLLSLATLILWPRIFPARAQAPEQTAQQARESSGSRVSGFFAVIPGPVVVLAVATAATAWLALPVETIGSRFGGVPQGLPHFQIPEFSWNLVKQLFAPTITIALLGAIESLLCARVADNMTGDRHDPNQELMAQGIANIVTPFFGGLPATGTIARTVTNVRSGANSPVAGIVHAVALLFVILVAAPLAFHIPLASLAAILLFVAYNMGEWHQFARLTHFSLNYRTLVLATFALTVLVDLTVAVEVGLALACLFFIYRISSLTRIEALYSSADAPLPDGVAVYRVFGSLFFGAVGKLEALAETTNLPRRALILEMHQLINLDTTGVEALENLHRALQRRGCQLCICGANQQPDSLMRRSSFITLLGEANYFADLASALAHMQKNAAKTDAAEMS